MGSSCVQASCSSGKECPLLRADTMRCTSALPLVTLALKEETGLMRRGEASENTGQMLGRCRGVVTGGSSKQRGIGKRTRRILALRRRALLRLVLNERRLRGLRGLCITHGQSLPKRRRQLVCC